MMMFLKKTFIQNFKSFSMLRIITLFIIVGNSFLNNDVDIEMFLIEIELDDDLLSSHVALTPLSKTSLRFREVPAARQ